MASSSKDRD